MYLSTSFEVNESIPVKFKYEKTKDNYIFYNIELKYSWKTFDISYDENIYNAIKIISKLEYTRISNSTIRVFLTPEDKNIKFKLRINQKYIVKTVYKYVNKLINENELFGRTKIL